MCSRSLHIRLLLQGRFTFDLHLIHSSTDPLLVFVPAAPQGPELLVDLMDYDYSLDLWSLGCMVGGVWDVTHIVT